MTTTRHVLVSTVLILLLGMSACSSSDGGGGAADGQSNPGSTPSSASTATGAGEVPEPEEQTNPLDEYLGVGGGTPEAFSEAAILKRQEEIARCMAAEGFEYVPFVEAGWSVEGDDSGEPAAGEVSTGQDLPPHEFAARFGYGITTVPPRDEAGKDPNEAIVARMSVAERVAYHRALYGDDTPLNAEGYLGGDMALSSTSCLGGAGADEPTSQEVAATERRVEQVAKSFSDLLERVGDLAESATREPRVVAATKTWASCLSNAGHPGFTEVGQPRAAILAKARELLGDDLAGVKTADATKLVQLQAEELALAVADERCLVDWEKTYLAVEHELRVQFVSANREELEDYRSAMAAATSRQE